MVDSTMGILPAASERRLRAHSGRLLIGLSGGVDSAVLLDALCAVAIPDNPLHAIHVNHHLQPGADDFARVAEVMAGQYGVPITVVDATVEVNGSLEDAARQARYRVFEDAMQEDDLLLLAHHREDQVETLLLSILRGQQPTGGMPQERPLGLGVLFRPLLPVARADLYHHARQRQLTWIDDPSNHDTRFDRNYIRHEVIPGLASRFQNAVARMYRATEGLTRREQLLKSYAHRDLERVRAGSGLDVAALLAIPELHRGEAVRTFLETLGLPQPGDGALGEVNRLLSARPDSEPAVRWQNVVCHRHRGTLWVTGPGPEPIESIDWRTGEAIPAVRGLEIDNDCTGGQGGAGKDGDRQVLILRKGIEGEFRCRQPGDRMTDGRRVKDVLVDAGVPVWLRDVLPLFSNNAGVVAIPSLVDYGTPMVVARGAELGIPGDSGCYLRAGWPGQPYSD